MAEAGLTKIRQSTFLSFKENWAEKFSSSSQHPHGLWVRFFLLTLMDFFPGIKTVEA
jgi:hypothetical protein